MLDWSTFAYFLTASVLLTLAPGPDILYQRTKSLADGARAGITVASGLVSGIIFHTTLVMVGVAALIKNSATALLLLKIFGAAYLLYLAFKAFQSARAGKKLSLAKSTAKSSSAALYKRGVLMNVLNPKVLLFFLAFLPQFVNLNRDGASLQILFLGVVFAVQGLIIFSCVALFAGRVRNLILRRRNVGQLLNFVEAAVLTLIAAGLILF